MARYKLAIRLVCLVVLIAGNLNTSFSQRYFTHFYTEADGLSSNMVYDVTQDTLGLLWFATRSGVCSYDGRTWKTYPVDHKLTSFSFPVVVLDEKGTLWTVPLHDQPAVYRFSGNNWIRHAVDSIYQNNIYASSLEVWYEEDQPVLAIGTNDKGLFIYRHQHWDHYTSGDGLLSNQIQDLKWVGTRLVVATNMGLSVIQNNQISNRLNDLLPSDKQDILAISERTHQNPGNADLNLWLLGEGWLGTLTEDSFSMIVSGFPISYYTILTRSFIYPTPDHSLYFGNPFYLYHWTPDNPTQYELMCRNNGLIADGATAVWIDRETNTWITGYRGISKIPSRRFTTYTTTEGLTDNEVTSVLEIRPGYYVIGHHGSLTFIKDNTFSTLSLHTDPSIGLPEVRVQDIDVDREGNLWLAVSTLGIAKIDRNREITWYVPGPDENFSSVIVLPDGRIFASCDKTLFQFSKPLNRFIVVPVQSLTNLGIRKLFAGSDSSLVCGTFSTGIIRIKGKTETIIRSSSDELASNVYAYFQDSHGTEWVGTVVGLYHITENELKRPDIQALQIERPIYAILEDNSGRLWFGTDNGIFRWDGVTLKHFTRLDGISGQEINRDAALVDHQGDLWFGTNYGLTRYNPQSDNRQDSILPPLVRLSWFEVNGDTLSCHQPVNLTYSENNLIFSFHAISFIDEDNISYSCKLEGFDTEWSAPFRSHNEQYRYNNLLPGEYIFCLKACNSAGIWSDPVCSAPIRIHTPFFFRWWFLLMIVLGVVAIVTMIIRFSLTWRYNLRLEKMVAIKTRELRRSEKMLQESNAAKDSFFSIIAHDLKSPFNALLGMLELLTTEYNEFTDEERQRILMNLRNSSARTINLLENLLTWAQAQKGILPFNPEKFDMKELILENLSLFESAARAKNITIHPPTLDILLVYADRNMINTVIRNLMSNAIKFTFEGGEVTLSVMNDFPHEVTFSIRDNGQGMDDKLIKNLFNIDRRTTLKGTNNETGTGLGLILSKDFVVRNNGRIWVTSEKDKGTTFWFTIPTSHK